MIKENKKDAFRARGVQTSNYWKYQDAGITVCKAYKYDGVPSRDECDRISEVMSGDVIIKHLVEFNNYYN